MYPASVEPSEPPVEQNKKHDELMISYSVQLLQYVERRRTESLERHRKQSLDSALATVGCNFRGVRYAGDVAQAERDAVQQLHGQHPQRIPDDRVQEKS